MPTPFTNPSTPNQADFLIFIGNQPNPPNSTELPSGSLYPTWALDQAIDIALNGGALPAILYVLATYNLAYHLLLKIAQDQSGQTYFTTAQRTYGLLPVVTTLNGQAVGPSQWTAGIVSAATDQGTSTTIEAPEWTQTLTLQANDLLKTPWGRYYLDYAQSYGPTIVDVT